MYEAHKLINSLQFHRISLIRSQSHQQNLFHDGIKDVDSEIRFFSPDGAIIAVSPADLPCSESAVHDRVIVATKLQHPSTLCSSKQATTTFTQFAYTTLAGRCYSLVANN